MAQTSRSLEGDEGLAACIALLMALSAAPDGSVDAEGFRLELGLDGNQLDDAVETLLSIADDRSGARIAIARDGGKLRILGDAGRLSPIRLTPAETLALDRALAGCGVDEGPRRRLSTVLGAVGEDEEGDGGRLLAGDPLLGGFFPIISESIAIGGRLRISYRSEGSPHATEREVDPGYIEVAGDAAYLVGWDVAKDAQRIYRLDRIEDLELTDDSVILHDFERTSMLESLSRRGETAVVRWSSADLFARTAWAGIHRDEATADGSGGVCAPVSFTSPSWLFDRVLAAGGEVSIVAPSRLRTELVAYARGV